MKKNNANTETTLQKGVFYIIAFVFLMIPLNLFLTVLILFKLDNYEQEYLNPIVDYCLVEAIQPKSNSNEFKPINVLTPEKEIKTPQTENYTQIIKDLKGVWIGKVSHYSRAGCLGCSKTLTMANGEPLDDSRLTIAFNKAPLNSRVLVKNLDNGKSVEATVTDTGGFESLGRIADLTPAVAKALETKTDISTVQIKLIK